MDREEKNKLAEENLRLVYSVINKEFGYKEVLEDRENYIEEGLIGLTEAINTFDPSKQAKFSTHAYRCIKYKICNYIRDKNALKRKLDNEYKKSLEESVGIDAKEKITLKDSLIDPVDYYLNLIEKEWLLDLVKSTNIQDIDYIVLKKAEGYTYEEIGEMIGLCKSTVQSRLDTARKRIGDIYEMQVF